MADLGWEDDDLSWGGIQLTSKNFAPVMINGDEFAILGQDPTASIDAFIERKGLIHVPGFVVEGGFVFPQIVGASGTVVQISLGAHDHPDSGIDYETQNFTIGVDEFVDFAVSGRYLAIKFESSGIPSWKLQSYKITYEVIGQH